MVASPFGASRGEGFERHGHAVHAVAQAGGPRTILEDVAKMPAATVAVHGRAHRPVRGVGARLDGSIERRPEARPTSPAVILGGRGEEIEVASCAGVGPASLFVQERAGEWTLGAALPQNGILLRREEPAPLGVAAADLEWLGTCGMSSNEAGKPHAAHDECAPCDHRMHPPGAKPQRHLIRFHSAYCYGTSAAGAGTHLFVIAREARGPPCRRCAPPTRLSLPTRVPTTQGGKALQVSSGARFIWR